MGVMMRQMRLTQSGVLGCVCLLAGPISYTSTWNSLKVSTFHWMCILFVLLILMGANLPLCIVVTLSQNAITCFWSQVEYKIVFFHFA